MSRRLVVIRILGVASCLIPLAAVLAHWRTSSLIIDVIGVIGSVVAMFLILRGR
jgi:hypothetical protein